jgi:hypothetical protein
MLRQLGSIIALKPAARFETPTHLLRTSTARMQQRQVPPGLQRSRYVLRQSSETPRATVDLQIRAVTCPQQRSKTTKPSGLQGNPNRLVPLGRVRIPVAVLTTPCEHGAFAVSGAPWASPACVRRRAHGRRRGRASCAPRPARPLPHGVALAPGRMHKRRACRPRPARRPWFHAKAQASRRLRSGQRHKRAARSYGEPHLVQAAQWSRLSTSAATRRESGVSVEPRRLAGLGSKTGWQPVRESRGLELEHSAALTG